jgi:SAM-dependent methyltransferase
MAIISEAADGTAANDYDAFGADYAIENEDNLINGHYTRPAMVDLAGEVTGHKILDAGCGAGPLAEALRERGAVVSGFDSSTTMIDLARQRLGADTDLRVADLDAPLPYPDAAFDDVVCALVLHYLPDWTGPLAELRRVLRPGGRLILAVNHPMLLPLLEPGSKYFGATQLSAEYEFNGRPAVLTYWHRPLHAMSDAFTTAGFRITVISEPPVAPGAVEKFADELGGKDRFVSFLFFVLEAA